MSFYQYTADWIKGEIFEAILITVFGIFISLSGFLFWKLGTTPNAKVLLIPLLFVGLLATGTGLSMYFSNQKRLVEFEKSYIEDADGFVRKEKDRVEGFMYMYQISNILVTVFLLLGIASLWFTRSQYMQAAGIALVVFGLALYVIDYFSKERALIYQEKILNELKQ
jgi:hypothetical protein